MPHVSVNGIDLYYETHGAGSPVLLAAGLGGAGTYWREQVEAFAKRHRIILYDQRGTGRSTHVEVESIEQLAEDTIGLLDALGLGRVHYLGHSTGGAVGQALAIEHPERLIDLVIYASVHRSDPYRERLWGLRKAVLETMGPEPYARLTTLVLYPPWWIAANAARLKDEEALTARMLSKPEIMASRIGSILAFDRSAQLSRIATPTMVLCAKDDITTPFYFSEQLAALIPGARLVAMERGGHACSKTMPDEFNRHVLDFFATRS